MVSADTSGSNASDCPASKEGTTRAIESFQGVCIESHFENETVDLVVSNPTSKYIENSGLLVKIGRHQYYKKLFNISPGESFQREVNITQGLHAFQDNHSVFVSTFGDNTTYNFTREIDASNSPEVLTPYIKNVTVANGTIDGDKSAVAYVTLANPSIQTYSSKLFVHTLGTEGSFYPVSIRPGGTRTIKVELLDDDGQEIAGEARLYSGNLTESDGGLDQMGFVGTAGEQTETWNESFEPVRPTWMDNHYEYKNKTYAPSFGEKLSGGYEIGGIPIAYLVLSLFGIFVVVRRFR
ncbi:hypothetical protein GCM10009000_015590 [Halobacterium noricense]